MAGKVKGCQLTPVSRTIVPVYPTSVLQEYRTQLSGKEGMILYLDTIILYVELFAFLLHLWKPLNK